MYFIQIRYSDKVATNNMELRTSNNVICNGTESNGMYMITHKYVYINYTNNDLNI